jgi:hypothetical protein
MSKQSGVGTLTYTGRQIAAWHHINGGAISFTDFYISSKVETVSTITDSAVGATYNVTKSSLSTLLGANLVYPGSVSAGGSVVISGSDIQIPLLLSIPLNAITNDTNIYTFFIMAEDPADSNIEKVFAQGCLYYDDNGTPGVFSDDGNTIAFSYIHGTNLLLRVNLQYSTALPTDVAYTVVDNQAIEIEQHNNDTTSHEATLLKRDGSNDATADLDIGGFKLTDVGTGTTGTDAVNVTQLRTEAILADGSNPPTTDIDWDDNKITTLANGVFEDDAVAMNQVRTTSDFTTTYNIATSLELSNLLTITLPKRIDHDITITLTASITISAVLGSPYYRPILFEGFHGEGSIEFNLNNFDINQGAGLIPNGLDCIKISGCQIPITITTPSVSSNIITSAYTKNGGIYIEDNPGLVTIEKLYFNMTSGINYAAVYVNGSSNVEIINNFFRDGTYGIVATNNSSVYSFNNEDDISSQIYGLLATNNSVIKTAANQPANLLVTRGGIIADTNTLSDTGMTLATFPIITNSTSSPVGSVTPTKIGDMHIDTSSGSETVYISYGTTNSDWIAVN